MQEPTALDPLEQELEAALASLTPGPIGIFDQSLWFRAALAREHRRTNRWRAAAAIAIVGGAAAMLWRPKPIIAPVVRNVEVQEHYPSQEMPAPAVWAITAPDDGLRDTGDSASPAYLRLRDALVQNGPQSVPATVAGEGAAAAMWRAGTVPSKLLGIGPGTGL